MRPFRDCTPLALEAAIDISHAVNKIVFQVPEILDFLLELNWEDIQNSPKGLNRSLIYQSLLDNGGHALQVLRWLLDHGAKISRQEYQMMATGPPPSDVLRYLMVRET